MKDAGTAMMGIGAASGDNRAMDAATQAVSSKLLEGSIAGANRVLFSISGGPDLTLAEVDEAARVIEGCADENANIINCQIIDETLAGEVHITVIATGFTTKPAAQPSLDYARRDLFAPTARPADAPASAQVTAAQPAVAPQAQYPAQPVYQQDPYPAYVQVQPPVQVQPQRPYYSSPLDDENYIPDFLRRQR